MTTKRGRYSQEFKLEAIKLVEDQGRKIPEVANSLGIGKTTLENWVYKYRKEQQSVMPSEGKALTPELRRIQELEKQVRFFRSFKTEWMPKNGYDNMDEARQAVNDYIWGYYQSVRPHSFNEYLTPSEKERLYFNKNLLSTV
ncbi:transposase [Psychrobacter pacificensis]|nr:transposase [Psychrobacter pacificensis]